MYVDDIYISDKNYKILQNKNSLYRLILYHLCCIECIQLYRAHKQKGSCTFGSGLLGYSPFCVLRRLL